VVGKRDETGAMLLPSEGELTPTMVAAAGRGAAAQARPSQPRAGAASRKTRGVRPAGGGRRRAKLQRTPYFCSGCPHNTSTKIPEGSRAMAGIGCHGMALSVPNRRTQTISHMGAEGVTWIGQAPFTSEQHVFQNLGRRHLHPFRPAGDPRGGGFRRQHHLQDPL
jgi:indolepyruvate ferredoxin oxidoreductase